MFDMVLNWLDLLWIPISYFFVARRHWVTAIMLNLVMVLALRLQVELMSEIGHANGLLPFMSMPILYRGFIIYGFFMLIFLILARFSRESNAYIHIAAAIGMFIISFCIMTGVMFL
ncbi:MAG: hypothetical protein AAF244_04645 [Pseudomonadota bacterium]